MSNLNSADIEAVKNSTAVKFLSDTSNDSGNIGNSINAFSSGSTGILKGQMWDTVREKYSKYTEVLGKQKEISSKISEAINKVIAEIQSNMNGYTNLDLSEIDEIKEQKTACEDKIDSIQAQMAETILKIDEEGKTYSEPKYDNGDLQANLVAQRKKLIELTRQIATMEKLKEICDKAEAQLNDLSSEMNSISNEVNSITPSDVYSFSPQPVAL